MNFNEDRATTLERARAIDLLLLDVDGIMTDGRLFYGVDGEAFKVFNTLDGHGIKLLQRHGVEVGIVSGRDSLPLARRADELGINLVYRGREDKLAVVEEICADRGQSMESIAYAGDDLPDLPVIRRVGLGISVPNAHDEVRRAARIETSRQGGHGAVREICDFLLDARGDYAGIIEAANGK